jgi:hypothetical protein
MTIVHWKLVRTSGLFKGSHTLVSFDHIWIEMCGSHIRGFGWKLSLNYKFVAIHLILFHYTNLGAFDANPKVELTLKRCMNFTKLCASCLCYSYSSKEGYRYGNVIGDMHYTKWVILHA